MSEAASSIRGGEAQANAETGVRDHISGSPVAEGMWLNLPDFHCTVMFASFSTGAHLSASARI